MYFCRDGGIAQLLKLLGTVFGLEWTRIKAQLMHKRGFKGLCFRHLHLGRRDGGATRKDPLVKLLELPRKPSKDAVKATLSGRKDWNSMTVTQILKTLASLNRAHLIFLVLQVLHNEKRSLDARKCTLGISTCARASLWREAINLLTSMSDAQIQGENAPKSKFSAVGLCGWFVGLQNGGDEKRFGDAWVVPVVSMCSAWKEKSGDTISFNAGISSCEKGGHWRHAIALFELMCHAQVPVDVITFNSIISSCDKGKQTQHALAIYETMPSFKVVPDLITFNALISSCGRTSFWDSALAIFESMVVNSMLIAPSVISINSMLMAYGKGKQWQKAMDLMEGAWKARLSYWNMTRGWQESALALFLH